MPEDLEKTLIRLSGSRFRAGQKLRKKDERYYLRKGEEEIRKHVRDFIEVRLTPAYPQNDTKQTPFRGHPAFTAQHATATCCRKCLLKWHGIEKGRELTDKEIDYIIELIMKWLKKEMYI